MSRLRPELRTTTKPPTADGATAYYIIHAAVESQDGLIHGRLHGHGESCAIGSYFDRQPNAALRTDLVDEVAAVNDSVPWMTSRQRKRHVLRWLKWKLTQAGMPGFRTTKKPTAKRVLAIRKARNQRQPAA